MRVRRFTSVAALGALTFLALGLLGSPALASSPNAKGVTIVSVHAIPAQAQQHGGRIAPLAPSDLNVVTATSALGFRVTLHNGDTSKKRNVTAILAIDRVTNRAGPLVEAETVAEIGPKQTKTVTFGHLGEVPFASRTNLTVRLTSGPFEVYPVIFSLPSGTAAAAPAQLKPVPNVVGLDQQEAIARLQAKGYEILIAQAYSPRPAGVVVGEAAGGSSVSSASSPGRIIRITVSEGKKPPSGG